MICEKCGKEISDDSNFCSQCGTPTSTTQLPTETELYEEIAEGPDDVYLCLLPLLIIGMLVILFTWMANPIGLFGVLVISVISALVVYDDANEIGVGARVGKQTFDAVTWTPKSWGLVVLLIWVVGLPLYMIKRRRLISRAHDLL